MMKAVMPVGRRVIAAPFLPVGRLWAVRSYQSAARVARPGRRAGILPGYGARYSCADLEPTHRITVRGVTASDHGTFARQRRGEAAARVAGRLRAGRGFCPGPVRVCLWRWWFITAEHGRRHPDGRVAR